MDKIVGIVALRIVRDLKAREAEYDAAVDAWYRNGDGRSPRWVVDPETGRSRNMGGKGYAYPECIHGSSNWTDYDNICGGCEGDWGTVYERALSSATQKVDEANRRMEWLMGAPSTLGVEKHRELLEWAMEPIRQKK